MNNKKTSYKLLSLDLDGTLLSPLFKRAKKADCLAIQEYMSCGGMPLINTGRAPWAIVKTINRINKAGENRIRLLSCWNGSYIWDFNDNDIVETKISHAYAKKIFEIAQKYKGVHIWFFMKQGIKEHKVYVKPLNPILKAFFKTSKLVELEDTSDLSCYKIDILSLNKKTIAEVHHDLVEHNLNHITNITHSSPRLIEVTAHNTNKAKALEYFSKKYNINKAEIVSMGDSFNDLSAFKNSGLSVGISPKNTNLFEHCGALIKHKSKGVAQAIYKHVLRNVDESTCKLIFTDLDGTLIDGSTKLFSNETKFALQQCTNHLIPIAIASGRGIHDGLNIVKAMELNPKTDVYIIGNNGATIYDIYTDKYILREPIPTDTAKKVFDMLKGFVEQANGKMGFILHQDDPQLLFYNEQFWKPINLRKTGDADKYDPWIYCKSKYIDEYPDNAVCFKYVIKFANHKEALQGNEQLRKAFPNLEVCLSSDVNVEINKKGINKNRAAKLLSEKINISLNDSIVLGDGQNDVPVLQQCPNSFAPDYAPDFVKKEAKTVIQGVGPCNFVARVVDNYVLRKK